MKRFIKMVTVVLVIATLLVLPANAQEITDRSSNYFSSYRAYCAKLSATSVGVSYHVLGLGTMDEIGASTISIQYSSNKENWTTAKTFTKENYSSMISTDSFNHAHTLSCTVPSGYYYRAHVTFYAKKGSGTAYRFYTTEII